MNHDKAQNLVAFLKAAFPQSRFPEESMEAYADLMAELDSSEAMYETIKDLMASEEHLPSWSAILEVYGIKRRREIEAAESQSRLEADRQLEAVAGWTPPEPARISYCGVCDAPPDKCHHVGPRYYDPDEDYLRRAGENWRVRITGEGLDKLPKVREAPLFVKEFLRRLQSNAQEFDPPELPEAPGGRCDDCKGEYENRYRYGALVLCEYCALSRARVANDLERGRHDMPTFYKEPKDEAAAQAQGAEGKTDALVEEEADART